MIKLKPNINWYRWVMQSIWNPKYASNSTVYIVVEAFFVCRSRRELAIALWGAVESPALMTFETIEKKLEEVIEEVADDER